MRIWILLMFFACLGCSDTSPSGDAASDTQPNCGVDSTNAWDAKAADFKTRDTKTTDTNLPDAMTVDASAQDSTAAVDAKTQDVIPWGDAASSFPYVLNGIWLIGWGGGLNHYSWARFSVSAASNGKADLLDGKGLKYNVPLWNCSGSTSWNTISSSSITIQLHWPSGTCTSYKSSNFTFTNFKKPGSYPKGAILEADVSVSPGMPSPLKAYKFPASQCDAAMKTCKDPL